MSLMCLLVPTSLCFYRTTYSCSLLLCAVRGSNLSPDAFPHDRAGEKRKYSIMVFVSVKPAHFSIFNLKVILPIFVFWMASHCVKYRLDALICVQFHPRWYGDSCSWDFIEVCPVQENVSTWGVGIVWKNIVKEGRRVVNGNAKYRSRSAAYNVLCVFLWLAVFIHSHKVCRRALTI